MAGSANIKVRPIKFAMLIEPNDARQIRDAIRLASCLWGGIYFPIIPLYKRSPKVWLDEFPGRASAHEVIKGYIDAFSPDILVAFCENVPDYLDKLGLRIVKPGDVWSYSGKNVGSSPLIGIGVLDLLVSVFEEWFKYKAKYPIKVVVPTIPREFELFWASVFGDYPPEIISEIDEHFSEALDLERPVVSPDAYFDLTEYNVLFPRRITSLHLEPYGRTGTEVFSSLYFLDASKLDDVIDYWNLRATGRNVLPVPKQFSLHPSFQKAVREFVLRERRPWGNTLGRYHVPAFIPSRHSTLKELEDYSKSIRFDGEEAEGPKSCYFTLQHWYPRIWDSWARSKDGGVLDFYGKDEIFLQLSNSSLEMTLEPLVPKFYKGNLLHSDGLCVNEVNCRVFGADEFLAEVYPRTNGTNLTNAISGYFGLYGDWKVDRHGLVKIIRSSSSEVRKIDSSEKVFFSWLADMGWEAALSTPGILAKQIYKRLGGHTQILANKMTLGLIEHMNGGSVAKDGSPSRSNRVGAEREMHVGEVKRRLSGSNKSLYRYQYFIDRGVFRIGLTTKCPNCQRGTWFPLSSLKEILECPKCLSSFGAAGNIEASGSGAWHYRTTGPFSVPNFADGAFAVLLTLDLLCSRWFPSMATTAVPSFTAVAPTKQNLEADFAMLWRAQVYGEEKEGVLFGECKTYGTFETKDFQRMRMLARMFPGAIIAFSTLKEDLTKREIEELTRLAKIGRKYWKHGRPINPVLIVTGKEIFSTRRPPACWSDAGTEREPIVPDLLSLCNATQNRYLKLPYWEEEWYETNAKKRIRNSMKP